MSRPTASETSAANDNDAPRLSSSSAISSFVRRSVPFSSSCAVTEAISLRPVGAKRPPAWREPDIETVGLK